MTNLFLNSLPPQGIKIYKLLQKSNGLTLKEIGKRMQVFPNAVYKSIKPLLEIGLIEKNGRYPVKLFVKNQNSLRPLLENLLNHNFSVAFGLPLATSDSSHVGINFFRTREERIKLIYKDIDNAKKCINLIASGLEVPAEMILRFKKAVDRGVKIRILVQKLDEVKKDMFNNWRKIGIEVKYATGINARIYVFDSLHLYLSTYDSKDKREATGVRFSYAPCARILDELFEQRWQKAKNIQVF